MLVFSVLMRSTLSLRKCSSRSDTKSVENIQSPIVKVNTIKNWCAEIISVIHWTNAAIKYPKGVFQLNGKLENRKT